MTSGHLLPPPRSGTPLTPFPSCRLSRYLWTTCLSTSAVHMAADRRGFVGRWLTRGRTCWCVAWEPVPPPPRACTAALVGGWLLPPERNRSRPRPLRLPGSRGWSLRPGGAASTALLSVLSLVQLPPDSARSGCRGVRGTLCRELSSVLELFGQGSRHVPGLGRSWGERGT